MNFLTALDGATQADLESVKRDIASLQAQLRKRKAQLKVIELSLGPPKDPPTVEEKRLAIAKLLLAGPRQLAYIAKELKLSGNGIHSVVNHAWFKKGSDGSVHLTTAGRTAANTGGDACES